MLFLSQRFYNQAKYVAKQTTYVSTQSLSYMVKAIRQVTPSSFDPRGAVTKVLISIKDVDYNSNAKIIMSLPYQGFHFHKKYIFPWLINLQEDNKDAFITAEVTDLYCKIYYQVVEEVGKTDSGNINDEF